MAAPITHQPHLSSGASRSGVACAPAARLSLSPRVPSWVDELVAGGLVDEASTEFDLSDGATARAAVTTVSERAMTLTSVRIPGVTMMNAAEFRAAALAAYRAIGRSATPQDERHIVRMWNFIPAITRPIGEGLDRYRAFNLGRFDGLVEWFAGTAAFERTLPTATGVGHDGDDLYVHALSLPLAGIPIENPRQRPAFRYSAAYGPRPPCFARATRVCLDGREHLLVGGTASVRGETSMHAGDLAAQLEETFTNLTALLAEVDATPADLSHAVVYVSRPDDLPVLAAAIALRLPGAVVEFVRADICRAELLVEIEAVAALPTGRVGG